MSDPLAFNLEPSEDVRLLEIQRRREATGYEEVVRDDWYYGHGESVGIRECKVIVSLKGVQCDSAWGENNTRARENGQMMSFEDVAMRQHQVDAAAYESNLNDDPAEYH